MLSEVRGCRRAGSQRETRHVSRASSRHDTCHGLRRVTCSQLETHKKVAAISSCSRSHYVKCLYAFQAGTITSIYIPSAEASKLQMKSLTGQDRGPGSSAVAPPHGSTHRGRATQTQLPIVAHTPTRGKRQRHVGRALPLPSSLGVIIPLGRVVDMTAAHDDSVSSLSLRGDRPPGAC